MRCRTLLAPLALCLALAMSPAFAQQFSSLEERMSSADFKAAGLEKLSPEELARLNAYIRGEVDKRTTQAHEAGIREQDYTNATRMGFSDYSGDRDVITSTIVGKFLGWTGKTTFTLENGQVWKQVDPNSTFSVNLATPTIRITPGFMGVWYLQVEGYGTTVKVERIK